ncbi:MAG: response regulator transcription factor [Myxococcales bacterium]
MLTKSRPSAAKRALIVEDQTTLRELLEELFASVHYETESAGTGAEARSALTKGRFDLVLLDLVLPDAHGFELLSEIKSTSRGSRVVVLTAHSRPAIVKEATARGAHGVVTKGAPLRELREAIDRVSAGGVFYCSQTSQLLHEAAVTPECDQQLTSRQREVVRLVASGMSTKEIATRLILSEKTVTNHRTRIMERLGVHDVAGLTRYAIAQGLVDAES